MALPWLGAVPAFTLKSGDQFRAKPMPLLNSAQYAKDYNEVKTLGARVNSTRTPEQTQLAYFSAGQPLILLNRTLREIAAAHTQKMGDNARLLALGTMGKTQQRYRNRHRMLCRVAARARRTSGWLEQALRDCRALMARHAGVLTSHAVSCRTLCGMVSPHAALLEPMM